MAIRDAATLTCQEVVERLTDLLEGALEAQDRASIEQHLLVCPPCTLHLAQVKATISLAQELRGGAEPTPLLAIFRRWKAKP